MRSGRLQSLSVLSRALRVSHAESGFFANFKGMSNSCRVGNIAQWLLRWMPHARRDVRVAMHAKSGDAGSARELQRFALGAFPSFVTRVSGAGMHAFIGQDPMSPAVILFTDKDETPPVYAALSVNLRKYRCV